MYRRKIRRKRGKIRLQSSEDRIACSSLLCKPIPLPGLILATLQVERSFNLKMSHLARPGVQNQESEQDVPTTIGEDNYTESKRSKGAWPLSAPTTLP